MDITELRYFVAVAEAGSMTVAARRCHVSQPSLSAQIRKLEESVGVRLFDRHGKGAALTEAGELLLPRARRVLTELGAIETGLRQDAAAGRGRLVVGAIPTIAPYLLPRAIERTRADFPECTIQTTEDYTERLIDLLVDNRLDVAVVSLPVEHALIEVEAIGYEPLVVALPAGDPLARSERIGLSELRRQSMIILNEANCLGQQVSAYCRAKGMDGQIVCEAAQLITVLELVRQGAGVALVPELAARAGHVKGVVFRPTAKADAKRPIALARRVGRTRSVLAERFARHAAEQLADRRGG